MDRRSLLKSALGLFSLVSIPFLPKITNGSSLLVYNGGKNGLEQMDFDQCKYIADKYGIKVFFYDMTGKRKILDHNNNISISRIAREWFNINTISQFHKFGHTLEYNNDNFPSNEKIMDIVEKSTTKNNIFIVKNEYKYGLITSALKEHQI